MAHIEQSRLPQLTIRDPKVMRAMAHPARLAILEYLTDGHEATATECAEVCGLSPSATSYHLRELAKVGLLEEAPSRGDGRERVWRAAVGGYQIEVEDPSPETFPAALALLDFILIRDDAQARRWFERAAEEPKEWFDAASMTRRQLVMTAAELTALFEAVNELMAPYGRAERKDPPPGARGGAALSRAFPPDNPPPKYPA